MYLCKRLAGTNVSALQRGSRVLRPRKCVQRQKSWEPAASFSINGMTGRHPPPLVLGRPFWRSQRFAGYAFFYACPRARLILNLSRLYQLTATVNALPRRGA
jgi:hypothetical protein